MARVGKFLPISEKTWVFSRKTRPGKNSFLPAKTSFFHQLAKSTVKIIFPTEN